MWDSVQLAAADASSELQHDREDCARAHCRDHEVVHQALKAVHHGGFKVLLFLSRLSGKNIGPPSANTDVGGSRRPLNGGWHIEYDRDLTIDLVCVILLLVFTLCSEFEDVKNLIPLNS